MLAERWRVHYNTVRPHSSLGYRPPAPAAWLTNNTGHGEVESNTLPTSPHPRRRLLNSELRYTNYPAGTKNRADQNYAIDIPYGRKLLSFHNPHALIKGLDQEPESDWPNVQMVHICFQIMVGCGSLLSLFALLAGWLTWRRPPLINHKPYLKALVLVSPLVSSHWRRDGW